jgi:hypothetical protein
MPPRKKKVVEESPLIVEAEPIIQVIDTAVEQVDEVAEIVNEEVAKTIDETLKKFDDLVETFKEEATEVVETAKEEFIKETTKAVVNEVTKINEVVSKTLSELFLDFIKKSNDSKVVLSKESIDILNKIFSLTPNFLDDIEKSLLEVVKDGKIDSVDIPHLVLLIQKLYKTIYKIKTVNLDSKRITVICGETLKFVSYFLITERRIKIEEKNAILFLEQINTLIDSCVGLLSFPNTVKVKGCFDSLFGKK